MENMIEELIPMEEEVAEDALQDLPTENATDEQESEPWEEMLAREATALQEIYPSFELTSMMENETFRALLSGEVRPTLRQVYEMLCPEALTEARVQARVQETVSAAVETAVVEAVARAEENLLRHIQARGMRPRENGSNAASGVRTHPAVHRLTREDRAKLAQMAQRGENVQL